MPLRSSCDAPAGPNGCRNDVLAVARRCPHDVSRRSDTQNDTRTILEPRAPRGRPRTVSKG
eukprot:3473491-Alexandrium_andersonii.AAC.1